MVNRTNYHLVKEYLRYLNDVQQLDSKSIGRYWFYLKYLLLWADELPFAALSNHRPTFPTFLAAARLDEKDQPLAPTTLKKIVQTAKRFLTWLKLTYPREYRALSPAWIESLRQPRGPQPVVEHEFVTLDEVKQLASLEIDEADLALRRDQAAAAMLYLSGMRAGAFSTLPISAVDLANKTIKQWTALGVETKNSKSATTYLLDIPELQRVVEQWDSFVRSQLPATAMWYTPIISQWGEQTLSSDPPGANRSVAVSKRLRLLFDMTGLEYKSPHKFRHGHAVYSLQHAKTMADYKAVSMNLMHADIRVTDGIYAPLASNEIQQRIAGLTGGSLPVVTNNNDFTTLVQGLSKEQLSQALMAIANQMSK